MHGAVRMRWDGGITERSGYTYLPSVPVYLEVAPLSWLGTTGANALAPNRLPSNPCGAHHPSWERMLRYKHTH